MKRQRELETMARAAGFERVRNKKHTIWFHPCGARLVTSQSPSDRNALRQARRELVKICRTWGLPEAREGT